MNNTKFLLLEKLQKFCSNNNVSVNELALLISQLDYLISKQLLDICYEDGFIGKVLKLDRKPVAIKVFDKTKNKFFWAALQTSYPQKLDFMQAQSFLKTLQPVSHSCWRIIQDSEIKGIMSCLNDFIKIWSIYDLNFSALDLIPKKEKQDISFGYFSETDLQKFYLFYPNCRELDDDGNLKLCKMYWWPVCDAD